MNATRLLIDAEECWNCSHCRVIFESKQDADACFHPELTPDSHRTGKAQHILGKKAARDPRPEWIALYGKEK